MCGRDRRTDEMPDALVKRKNNELKVLIRVRYSSKNEDRPDHQGNLQLSSRPPTQIPSDGGTVRMTDQLSNQHKSARFQTNDII